MTAHPLEIFRYCPVCGSEHFVTNDFKSRSCKDCGFTYYGNVAAANAAFIINDNRELLVVRRANEPAKGTLDLPGGFADMDESAEQGVAREVEEETGMKVTTAEYLFSLPNTYDYSGMTIHTLDMFFRCTVADCTAATARDDAAECLWVPLGELRSELFGLASIRKGIEEFLKKIKNLHI